jgi:hypothetical protein
MNGDDVPRDLLAVVTQEVIGEGLGFAGLDGGEATAIGGRDNHGLVLYARIAIQVSAAIHAQHTRILYGEWPLSLP